MKRRLGFYAAIGAAVCTILFCINMVVGLFTPSDYFSHAVCLLLSWCYVLLVCDLCAHALPERRAAANAALAFAVMYALLINIVYFAQITVIRQNAMNPAIISDFRMIPGTLYFAYDILGYGLMALSTLFLALVVRPQNRGDRLMKILLLIHGCFFPLCVIMPMTNLFSNAGSDVSGSILLIGWCIYFAPIMILAIRYTRNSGEAQTAAKMPAASQKREE